MEVSSNQKKKFLPMQPPRGGRAIRAGIGQQVKGKGGGRRMKQGTNRKNQTAMEITKKKKKKNVRPVI